MNHFESSVINLIWTKKLVLLYSYDHHLGLGGLLRESRDLFHNKSVVIILFLLNRAVTFSFSSNLKWSAHHIYTYVSPWVLLHFVQIPSGTGSDPCHLVRVVQSTQLAARKLSGVNVLKLDFSSSLTVTLWKNKHQRLFLSSLFCLG